VVRAVIFFGDGSQVTAHSEISATRATMPTNLWEIDSEQRVAKSSLAGHSRDT
jgi:hypothetical protein